MKRQYLHRSDFLCRDAFRCTERRHENRREFLGFIEKVVQLLSVYDSTLKQQFEPEYSFIRFL